MDAFTIADRTTLGHAMVLAESFRTWHQTGTFTIVWLDDTDTVPALTASGDSERIRILPANQFPEVATGLLETAIAGAAIADLRDSVLPGVTRGLLAECTPETALAFLDARAFVLAPLSTLEQALDRSALVLAALSPIALPDDGTSPTNADVATMGAISSAMFAVRSDATGALRAGQPRSADTMTAPQWLALLASRSAHVLLHDGTCPASRYSMLPEMLTAQSERLSVDGQPVEVLDLRELDVTHPWLLSADDAAPRILLSAHPRLNNIVADYAQRVLMTQGRLGLHDETPPFTRLANGYPIDATMRKAYVAGVAAAADGNDVPPPAPFGTSADADRLLAWLQEPPSGGATRIGRYALAARALRRDLIDTFPSVGHSPNADEGFAAWITASGTSEPAYDASLLSGSLPDSPPPTPARVATGGINVAGFLRGELGIGVAARASVAALQQAHVPTHLFVESGIASRQEADLPAESSGGPFDVTLLCVNAPETPMVRARLSGIIDDGYVIGQWFWELEEPPNLSAASCIDEIWAATTFMRDAFASTSPIPVTHMPIPLYRDRETVALSRAEVCAELGISDDEYLLFSFDHFSTMERKNPLGLIAAFTRAFPHPGDGPRLLIKTINANRRVADAERLRIAATGRSDITIVEKYLSEQHLAALFAHTRCYVSLHRSEGLGLTIAEAMTYGRPTIVTGYSGNMDFTTEDNSYIVPWRYTTVPDDAPPYRPGARWADPDLEAAAAAIEYVVAHEDEAEQRGARGTDDLRRSLSRAACGAAMAQRLYEIQQMRSQRHDSGPQHDTARARRWTPRRSGRNR